MRLLKLDSGVEVAYLGPDLERGPLPAVFYFALSAKESLCQDPFNQPALALSAIPLRVFSLTLPGHGAELPPTQALYVWAQKLREGCHLFEECIGQVELAVGALLAENVLIPDRIGVMGLSRGVLVAAHAAARIAYFRTIVGFAPLTKLGEAKEFQGLESFAQALDMEHLVEALAGRTLRYYIGNLDTRVGTRSCFDFIEKLALATQAQKIRSPQVELILTPSIGHQGHGTSPEVFRQGAHWMQEKLGCTHGV